MTSLGDIVWAGPAVRLAFGFGKAWICLKALGDDLIWGSSAEDTLTPRIIGGIEAAKQLLEVAMQIDGDARRSGH